MSTTSTGISGGGGLPDTGPQDIHGVMVHDVPNLVASVMRICEELDIDSQEDGWADEIIARGAAADTGQARMLSCTCDYAGMEGEPHKTWCELEGGPHAECAARVEALEAERDQLRAQLAGVPATGHPTAGPSDAWVIGRFTDATAQHGDRTFEMWDDDVHRTSATALHHHVMHVEDPDPWSWHIYALVRIAAAGSSAGTIQAPDVAAVLDRLNVAELAGDEEQEFNDGQRWMLQKIRRALLGTTREGKR